MKGIQNNSLRIEDGLWDGVHPRVLTTFCDNEFGKIIYL